MSQRRDVLCTRCQGRGFLDDPVDCVHFPIVPYCWWHCSCVSTRFDTDCSDEELALKMNKFVAVALARLFASKVTLPVHALTIIADMMTDFLSLEFC